MSHQVIDIRVGRGVHHVIDAESEREHSERMQAARDRIPSGVRYVVAPAHRVQGRDGKWFEAGAPITPEDVAADAGWPVQGRAAWKVFEHLVFELRVLENYAYQPPSDTR